MLLTDFLPLIPGFCVGSFLSQFLYDFSFDTTFNSLTEAEERIFVCLMTSLFELIDRNIKIIVPKIKLTNFLSYSSTREGDSR